ncbi:splicing regulator SDE2 [Uranotaenia lowii]|uniref:splicing regulator SDE2 n=1 Tax=Uranotaenia lowii TaxID=190385 RepID=UPI00247A4CC6|nr:splicing regulator SDE2 [Uranotaenia lowii]
MDPKIDTLEIIHANRRQYLKNAVVSKEIVTSFIEGFTNLPSSDYYLTQNGKRICLEVIDNIEARLGPVHVQERLLGGKGGFGSMLRAIGAQIEKTTNREACRDLSGRRLRDINEEKRLKAYLDKQQNAPEDERAKLQKKIDKLLAKPKHEFHDEEYNQARSDLTQNLGEAVEEGFRKAAEAEKAAGEAAKRKAEELSGKDKGSKKLKKKQTKGALWLGSDDLGSSSDSESDGSSDSACSSSEGSSSAGPSSGSSDKSAKQTVTSDEEKGKPETCSPGAEDDKKESSEAKE